MDSVDGSPLERAAQAVRQPDHLLEEAQGVGGERRAAGAVARLPGAAERAPEDQVGRVLRGRLLRPRQKGGPCVGKTKRGKGTKWMVLADGAGTPLGAYLDAASPSEVTLLERTLETVSVRRLGPGRPRTRPERLIADLGYDSDPLRERLRARGIRPIIPHRANRKRPPQQDGRELRRYRRRWVIERTIGWIGNFRRLTVRWDRLMQTYGGFFHMACALITLRKLLKVMK